MTDLFTAHTPPAKISPPPTTTADRTHLVLPSCEGIVELLGRAMAAGLKYPKLRLQLANGEPLRIHVAGERSQTPGYLMLTDGGPFGDNKFYGRVSPEGKLELYREGKARQEQLVALLVALAEDPAKVAAEYGHLTGGCCFCRLPLSDARSLHVGYGKICAGKFGLPWGAK